MEVLNIVLVEDNPGDVRLMQEALAESGIAHQLTVASDGEEALVALRQVAEAASGKSRTIVLLDLNLPKMPGLEVLARVKADPQLKRIPIVVLTTSAAPDDVGEVYDLHANCYVQKSLDLTEYLHAVHMIEEFWCRTAELPLPP